MGLYGPRGEKGDIGEAGKDGLPGTPGTHGRPADKGEKGKKPFPEFYRQIIFLHPTLNTDLSDRERVRKDRETSIKKMTTALFLNYLKFLI